MYIVNPLSTMVNPAHEKCNFGAKLKVNGKRKPFLYIQSIDSSSFPLHSHILQLKSLPETYCKPMAHFRIFFSFVFFAQKWYRHRIFWGDWIWRVGNWYNVHRPIVAQMVHPTLQRRRNEQKNEERMMAKFKRFAFIYTCVLERLLMKAFSRI